MIVKTTENRSAPVNPRATIDLGSFSAAHSLLSVLWRRRWILVLSTAAALLLTVGYLILATPIYTSTSSVYIEQNGNKILADSQGYIGRSDSFLYTQAEILKSAPILSSALDAIHYREMRTFAKIDNPVAWLQMGRGFTVEVGKKDDVVTVSMDSPYPQEAAEVVNSVVDAYMTAQGKRKKSTAAEMLRVLQKEKDNRYAELTAKIAEMLKFKEQNGTLSFQADKGNIIVERLAQLSDNLTELELQTQQLKAESETAQAILKDPSRIRAYVEDLQTKNNAGDRQYDEVRSEIVRYQTSLFSLSRLHGENSVVVQTMKDNLNGLNQVLATKERAIAEERATHLEQDLQTAQAKLESVRGLVLEQQKTALDLNSKQAQYARLEDESRRIEKQCSDLDTRVKEVAVNSEDSGALNIQIVEVGAAEQKPSKPQKGLTLSIALLAGLALGTALSLGFDWMDQRIRSLDEVSDSLGIPILGVVPQMNGAKTQAMRGQFVHLETRSPVAEAYRTIRTAVHFASEIDLKTILVTSPSPSDGKSTTASNLAIALAQAGNRTLLIDADMRKPTQHRIFELTDDSGISSVVLGQRKLREVIRQTAIPRLDVLPCGPIPANPSEIVAGTRFAQVIRALIQGYDRVVIDSPPVMSVTDGRLLAASADATVLVLRMNRSTRRGAKQAIQALWSTNARVIGTIVNGMPQRSALYGYYSRYGGGYHQDPEFVGERPAGSELLPADLAEAALGQLPPDALLLSDASDSPQEATALS